MDRAGYAGFVAGLADAARQDIKSSGRPRREQVSDMTYAQQMARFVRELRFSAIPESVARYAKLLMLDSFGAAIAATDQAVAQNARRGIQDMPHSKGETKLWTDSDIHTTPQLACLANGIAAHALDYDDTHTASIVHGSSILTPLVMSLGEALGRRGEDMLSAFIAGWEIAARVGIAAKSAFHRRGFHTTAVAGFFGAVGAAARLYGLSAEQTVYALGLCGSQASGTTEFLANSSASKAFHAGWAAHGAIVSVNLARAGLTGPITVFEGKNGLFHTHGIDADCRLASLVEGLGNQWEIGRVSIKPYPCCHFAHGFIDCALFLGKAGLRAEAIKEIVCRVDDVPAGFICDPWAEKQKPQSAYGARFSLPFMVATALIDGELTPASFRDERLSRGDIRDCMQKVSYIKNPPGQSGFPEYYPGWLDIVDHNGGKFTRRQPVNLGNPDNPLSEKEVIAKFHNNSQDFLSTEKIESCAEFFMGLDKREKPAISALL